MIDIIIPAYNAHDTIKNTLLSICMQKFLNRIKVTIVDDCSDKNYDYLKDIFSSKLNLKIIRTKKNSGPGIARQLGLDNTNEEYIMFMDSDDLFVNMFSMDVIYDLIKDNKYDIICGNVWFENKYGKIDKTNSNYTVLHGKCFKRSFITKYNIKFSNYRTGEDNSFVNIFMLFNPSQICINSDVYIYKYRKNSITNSDDYKKKLIFINDYIDNFKYYISYFDANRCNENYFVFYIFKSFLYTWQVFNSEYDNINKNSILEKMSNVISIFDKYYFKIIDEYKFMFENSLNSIMKVDFLNYIDLIRNYK